MADEETTPQGELEQAAVQVTETAPAAPAEEEEVDWKDMARKHEKRWKEHSKRANAAEAELAKLKEASQSEQDKAIAAARKEATEQATAGFQDKIVRAEIRAQAAGKFADPDDAVRLLDLDDLEVFDSEGEVQLGILSKALDALLERKPHLRAGHQAQSVDVDAGKGAGPTSGDMNDQIRQRVLG